MSAMNFQAAGSSFVTTVDAVDAEHERTDARVVEVTFMWGEPGTRNALGTKHLSEGEELVIGEGDDAAFMVPQAVLGRASAQVMRREGDRIVLVPPVGASLWVDGWPRHETAFELTAGHTAEMVVGSFALRFRTAPAAKKMAGSLLQTIRSAGLGTIAGSAVVHAVLFGAVALFMPSLHADDMERTDRDRVELMQKMLTASAEREIESQPVKNEGEAKSATGGDTQAGEPATGEAGQLGKSSQEKHGHTSSKGDAAKTPTRDEVMKEASRFGMIDLVISMSSQERANEINLWGAPTPGGGDENALSMFNDGIHDGPGSGLWLSGPGEGGGGKGKWIGMDGFNGLPSLGKCIGTHCGPDDRIGNSKGKLPGTYVPKGISMRPDGVPQSNGRLPPEVIQRIVRQNDGRVRMCYEGGLRGNPSLAGRVEVRFMIGRTGAVAQASGGGDLPDAGVQSCVASTFYGMSFPEPQGGVVTVVYGYAFSPS